MQRNKHEILHENIVNFIHSGKLSGGMNVREIIQKVDELNSDEKIWLKKKLRDEYHNILQPDPISVPHYIVLIMQHGTEALKRACIFSFLVCFAISTLAEESSASSTLLKGMFAGITLFAASILFDSRQTTSQKKLDRLKLFTDQPSMVLIEPPEPYRILFSNS